MATKVTAAEAKARFAECVRAAEKGDAVVITRHGKDVAVIISPERLAHIERMEAAQPKEGLGSLIGGWEGSEELVRIIRSIKRTGSRRRARLGRLGMQ
jgi:prevent-host-death family protein